MTNETVLNQLAIVTVDTTGILQIAVRRVDGTVGHAPEIPERAS